MEILDGDIVLVTVEASIYRSDLAAQGIGDGCHGFALEVPPAAARDGIRGIGRAAGRLLRARARDQGVLFGQVLEEAAEGDIERLDRAAAELAELQAELADLLARQQDRAMTRAAPFDQLAAMLAVRSWRAPGAEPTSPAFAVAVAQEELLRRHASFAMPAAPVRPQASLVLLAAPDIDNTIAALRVLARGLGDHNVAVVLADDGADARTALVHTVVRGLTIAPPAGETADSLNAAISAVSGPLVVILRADPRALSSVALAVLLQAMAAAPGTVLIGSAGADSLARWGLMPAGTAPLDVPAPLDVIVAMSLAQWHEAGGLDATLDDGAGLDCADLCLKLRLLGTPVRAVASPPGLARIVAPDARRALRMATRFRERWGDFGVIGDQGEDKVKP